MALAEVGRPLSLAALFLACACASAKAAPPVQWRVDGLHCLGESLVATAVADRPASAGVVTQRRLVTWNAAGAARTVVGRALEPVLAADFNSGCYLSCPKPGEQCQVSTSNQHSLLPASLDCRSHSAVTCGPQGVAVACDRALAVRCEKCDEWLVREPVLPPGLRAHALASLPGSKYLAVFSYRRAEIGASVLVTLDQNGGILTTRPSSDFVVANRYMMAGVLEQLAVDPVDRSVWMLERAERGPAWGTRITHVGREGPAVALNNTWRFGRASNAWTLSIEQDGDIWVGMNGGKARVLRRLGRPPFPPLDQMTDDVTVELPNTSVGVAAPTTITRVLIVGSSAWIGTDEYGIARVELRGSRSATPSGWIQVGSDAPQHRIPFVEVPRGNSFCGEGDGAGQAR